jgi:PAS domain S-box-containing protein
MSATETGIMEEFLKNKWMMEEQQKIARIGTWEWDIQNDEAHWSEEAYRIYGLEPGAQINYKIAAKYRHPEDFLSLEKTLKDAIIYKKPYHTNYRIIRADGEIRYIQGRGKVYYNEKDIPIKIFGTMQDITEQKKIEMDLQKSLNRALFMVADLERELKNKDKFISVLSHELKNPLATIVTGLSFFQSIGTGNEQSANAGAIMKRQIHQMCRLVDDLLDLARINQNKIKLKKESILLNEMLTNVIEDFRPEFDSKGIQIVTEIEPQPVYLYADPIRITQCIWNIMSNALKFTNKDGTVKLSMKKEEHEVLIAIQDNGIGVSPEILPQLFDQFIQADDSPDPHINNGLGLGLFIVKSIIEMHHGKVTTISEGLGKGTLFTVHLPVEAEEEK